jgi:gliding motility-associated-like protein
MKFYASIIIFLFFSSFLVAQQLENSNWHFGNGVAMNISPTDITISSSPITVSNGVTPASISNAAGQFQCSSNGTVVLNMNGDVVDNGQFNTTGLENIFLPVPNQPNRYYLFRSAEWGVDYSIVDMNLNGGAGGIAENEKEIVFHNRSSQLMITQHANLADFWIVVADNDGGNFNNIFIRSFLLSAGDLNLMQTFSVSYTWAGYFNELDVARISPTCDKIAIMHKGHYLTVYHFDNNTGVVSNPLPAIDTFTNFTIRTNLDFSPNGEYVYVMGDLYKIDRFSLQDWNVAAIIASKVTIAQVGIQTWRDIKLSPYGDVLLYNSNMARIDRVINPDVDGPEFGVESTGALVTSSSYFFPNTPYLMCGLAVAQPAIFANNVCLGDTTIISFQFAADFEEFNWDFGHPDAVFETNDENPNWVIYPEIGSFEITINILMNGEWLSYSHFVTISNIPQVDLGPDVVICQGEFATLGVVNQLMSYQWNTGQTTSGIQVSDAGLYQLTVNNQGCIAADSVNVAVVPFIFIELDDTAICGSGSVTLDASNANAETYQWSTGEQTPVVTVDETGTYTVTIANSCFEYTESVQVDFVIFPEVLLPDDITACINENVLIEANYSQGSMIWNTGQQGPSISVNQPGTYTLNINHLGCTAQDEIEVTFIPEVSVQLQDYVFCDNETGTLNAFNQNATDYLWSTGESTPQINVNQSGSYWVMVSNSCFVETDTASVQYVNFPSPLLPGDIFACENDTVTLSPNYSNGNFTWSTGAQSQQLIVTQTGTYSVYINHLGCEAEDELEVVFQEYVSLNDLQIPNVFTPNGDAANHEFRPFLKSDPTLLLCNIATFNSELIIYNRWGKEISNEKCSWDGRGLSDQDMHDGTYYYIVNLRSSCYQRNEEKQLVGHVTLLR